MAKAKVISGDYSPGQVMVMGFKLMILSVTLKRAELSKNTVEEYELITEDIRKSASSGIIRGAVGATLLGPVGLLAGLSAKNKAKRIVAIKFKDGKNSLVEFDDKMYTKFVKAMF